MFGAMHFIDYINSHESRFNLFVLLTNSTQRICLVARVGRELVTFRSLNPTISLYTTHVDKSNQNHSTLGSNVIILVST